VLPLVPRRGQTVIVNGLVDDRAINDLIIVIPAARRQKCHYADTEEGAVQHRSSGHHSRFLICLELSRPMVVG
jgi:hypothetical protein